MKIPQLQVIDEFAKVPRSKQRQVPMIQEMQQGQKPEEAHIPKCTSTATRCKKRAPHLVHTSNTAGTKLKSRKTKRQSTSVKPSTKHLEREECADEETHDEQS